MKLLIKILIFFFINIIVNNIIFNWHKNIIIPISYLIKANCINRKLLFILLPYININNDLINFINSIKL